MNLKKQLFYLSLLSYLLIGISPLIKLQGQDVPLAKILNKKYEKLEEDYPLVLKNGQDTYTFYYDKSTDNLKVKQVSENQYLVIDNIGNDKVYFSESYNNNSEINDIYIKYMKGTKKKSVFNKKQFNDQYIEIDGTFYDDKRVKYSPISNKIVQQGEIYLFGVKKTYNDPKYFIYVLFVDRFPILKKKITFVIPQDVEVELLEKNFEGYNITKKTKFEPKKNINIIEYTLKDIPASFNESNMQGPTYLQPHILVLSKSFKHKGMEKTLFKTTDDLYKWYAYLIKQIKEKPEKLTGIVNQLTKSAKTDEEKIKNIFYWVQDNIRYIAYEDGIAGFKPDESQNVYQKRYGDCKGMANLTVQMLKKAGFDARRTWIGTRYINYDYSTPSLAVDNHMIATLFYKGKKYFLDATESYVPFGEYAERIQGRQVLIEDGDKYILDRVPVHNAEQNKKIITKTIDIQNDKLSGKVTNIFNGQSRTSFLQAYNTLRTEHVKDALKYYIKSDDENMQVDNIKTSDLSNRELPVKLGYDFVLDNAVSEFDDELYVDFDYDKEFSGMDFEKRKTPYQFFQKIDYTVKTVFNIPEGYLITEKPEDISTQNPDFKVELKMTQNGNKLIYTKHFIFKNALIKKENLPLWQNFYKKLKNYYSQQIVLKKK